ncbi:MAG: hypothetical protein ACRD18_07190 [Terriglobia bacterium]
MDSQDLPVDETSRDRLRQNLQALEQHLRHVEAGVSALREQLDRMLAAVQAVPERLPGSTIARRAELFSDHLSSEPVLAVQAAQGVGLSEKAKEDAVRFARVLVSEIELYNKEEVAQGRANKDLYARLKPQIGRSRNAYETRFGKIANHGADYFHEELVRALAQNDVTLLGTDYPDPSK